jgi:hypothetical protein
MDVAVSTSVLVMVVVTMSVRVTKMVETMVVRTVVSRDTVENDVSVTVTVTVTSSTGGLEMACRGSRPLPHPTLARAKSARTARRSSIPTVEQAKGECGG